MCLGLFGPEQIGIDLNVNNGKDASGRVLDDMMLAGGYKKDLLSHGHVVAMDETVVSEETGTSTCSGVLAGERRSLKELTDIYHTVGPFGGAHAKLDKATVENALPCGVVNSVHGKLMQELQRSCFLDVLDETRGPVGRQDGLCQRHLTSLVAGHFVQNGTSCEQVQAPLLAFLIDPHVIAQVGVVLAGTHSRDFLLPDIAHAAGMSQGISISISMRVLEFRVSVVDQRRFTLGLNRQSPTSACLLISRSTCT
jgi:hypothetical protein